MLMQHKYHCHWRVFQAVDPGQGGVLSVTLKVLMKVSVLEMFTQQKASF